MSCSYLTMTQPIPCFKASTGVHDGNLPLPSYQSTLSSPGFGSMNSTGNAASYSDIWDACYGQGQGATYFPADPAITASIGDRDITPYQHYAEIFQPVFSTSPAPCMIPNSTPHHYSGHSNPMSSSSIPPGHIRQSFNSMQEHSRQSHFPHPVYPSNSPSEWLPSTPLQSNPINSMDMSNFTGQTTMITHRRGHWVKAEDVGPNLAFGAPFTTPRWPSASENDIYNTSWRELSSLFSAASTPVTNTASSSRNPPPSGHSFPPVPKQHSPSPPTSNDGSVSPVSHRSSVDCSPSVVPAATKMCSHCQATSTPLWRREPQTLKPLCNACGLYLQQRHKLRPQELIDADSDAPLEDSLEQQHGPECSHCHTRQTSVWRRSKDGAQVCNACGVYSRLRGKERPLSLKRNRIKPRMKHSIN